MVLWFMRRKYLNDPTLFLHFCHYSPFKRTWTFIWIPIMQEMLVTSLIEISKMFHFKRFFPIHNCKMCPPPWLSGTIICTCLNLHYLRKLSYKYEFFWLSGSQGKTFSMTLPNFCIFVITSPLKRTWPFISTI
jgi:hypothetical protein